MRNNDKLVGGVSSNKCEQLRWKTFLWKEKFFTRCLPKLSCPKTEFKSSLSILKKNWNSVEFFRSRSSSSSINLILNLIFQNNDFNFTDLLITQVFCLVMLETGKRWPNLITTVQKNVICIVNLAFLVWFCLVIGLRFDHWFFIKTNISANSNIKFEKECAQILCWLVLTATNQ